MGSWAAAGGANSPSAFPLAPAQVWELRATDRAGLNLRLELKTTVAIRDEKGWLMGYGVESLTSGESLTFSKGRLFDVTLINDNVMRCFAAPNSAQAKASGFFMLTAREDSDKRFEQVVGYSSSKADILNRVQARGDGSSKLRRLR